MSIKAINILITLAVFLLIASQSFFIVDQTEQAIVLQLGQPKGEPRKSGIHLKTPFLQNVVYFDNRVLSVDPKPEQVVISSALIGKRVKKTDSQNTGGNEDADKTEDGPRIENVSGEPIIVDTFARYKITDPLQFLKTLRTIDNANSRIESILNDSTRAILGNTTLAELLSDERTAVMNEIRVRVNKKIEQDQLGIEIVDVRIVRADLTAELRTSTVRQMNSALLERATERRAKGEEKALEIRSTAEKERTVILAEAQRDSEIIRGQGDKQAIKTYADAFNVDKEFYSFIRSMEAYKKTMANDDTRLILSPDSEFFKYFENMNR